MKWIKRKVNSYYYKIFFIYYSLRIQFLSSILPNNSYSKYLINYLYPPHLPSLTVLAQKFFKKVCNSNYDQLIDRIIIDERNKTIFLKRNIDPSQKNILPKIDGKTKERKKHLFFHFKFRHFLLFKAPQTNFYISKSKYPTRWSPNPEIRRRKYKGNSWGKYRLSQRSPQARTIKRIYPKLVSKTDSSKATLQRLNSTSKTTFEPDTS